MKYYSLASVLWLGLGLLGFGPILGRADPLAKMFREPPDSGRPGVYWYFMDGNLSREGMTRDLESMKAAGIGHLIFLEVNVGVPRGPVNFPSEEGRTSSCMLCGRPSGSALRLPSAPAPAGPAAAAVGEAGTIHAAPRGRQGRGPGPGRFQGTLRWHRRTAPFWGRAASMRAQWEGFYRDVAVLAFPTPPNPATLADLDEKSLVYRAPFSSQPNVKPRIEAPADFPEDPPGAVIPLEKVMDLTDRFAADGTLDWEIPPGKWTVLRFVSRNNGASTRPAPSPASVSSATNSMRRPSTRISRNTWADCLRKSAGGRPAAAGPCSTWTVGRWGRELDAASARGVRQTSRL
jgi:hypothetical protein